MHQIQIQEEEDEPELYHEQQHNQNQSEPFAEICRDPPIVVGSSVCGPHRWTMYLWMSEWLSVIPITTRTLEISWNTSTFTRAESILNTN